MYFGVERVGIFDIAPDDCVEEVDGSDGDLILGLTLAGVKLLFRLGRTIRRSVVFFCHWLSL